MRTSPIRAPSVLLLLAGLLAARTAAAVDVFPLDQVRPGLEGVGRTVFEGTRVEEFKVKVLGVLENAVGPKQSLILARLEGGPLANTGVIAGMSGSPVFIDGKLLGAVSYGFPFAKETIAGITPFSAMVEGTRTQGPRPVSTRWPVSFRGGTLMEPEAFLSALKRPLPAVSAAPYLPGASLSPLPLPLVMAGLEPGGFDQARAVFAGLGFAPVSGGGATGRVGPLPDLEPGAAVGISLIEGDLDLSATGTVTHIEDGRLYAFGHPFFNLGPTQFPMRKAYVYSVFPSIYQSWKISSPAADAVGTIEQDRTTAIAGTLGKLPRMIPVEVKLTTSRGQERGFSFRIVDDELFSPVLSFVALLSVLQSTERAYGTSTIHVDGRVTVSSASGPREVRVEDLYTEGQPALQAATLVAAPVAFLMGNDFEHVTLEKLDVRVTSHETTQSATLRRAWLEKPERVRPGSLVTLKVQLRNFRGEDSVEAIPVTIPQNAPAGAYTLLVADAASLTALEQREMRQPFVPKDLDQLLRAINGLRHNNHLYARLMRADEGAIVGGEFLHSLPPSVLSVLGASDQGGSVVPTRMASVWDFDLSTERAVTGSRTLTLTVQR